MSVFQIGALFSGESNLAKRVRYQPERISALFAGTFRVVIGRASLPTIIHARHEWPDGINSHIREAVYSNHNDEHQIVVDGRSLVGLSSDGVGVAEKITVVPPLVLSNGHLSFDPTTIQDNLDGTVASISSLRGDMQAQIDALINALAAEVAIRKDAQDALSSALTLETSIRAAADAEVAASTSSSDIRPGTVLYAQSVVGVNNNDIVTGNNLRVIGFQAGSVSTPHMTYTSYDGAGFQTLAVELDGVTGSGLFNIGTFTNTAQGSGIPGSWMNISGFNIGANGFGIFVRIPWPRVVSIQTGAGALLASTKMMKVAQPGRMIGAGSLSANAKYQPERVQAKFAGTGVVLTSTLKLVSPLASIQFNAASSLNGDAQPTLRWQGDTIGSLAASARYARGGSALLSGASSLSAKTVSRSTASALVPAVGSLIASMPGPQRYDGANIAGATTLKSSSLVLRTGSALFAGTSTLAASTKQREAVFPLVGGAGAVSAGTIQRLAASALIGGTSSLPVTAVMTALASSKSSGSSLMPVAAVLYQMASASLMQGATDLTSDATGLFSVPIDGESTLASDTTAKLSARATMNGEGGLAAETVANFETGSASNGESSLEGIAWTTGDMIEAQSDGESDLQVDAEIVQEG